MTRIVLACAVVALVSLPSRAADHATQAKSPKVEITTSFALVVGAETLKPGTYRFQCVTVNDVDFLVITNDSGKEVARVPCKPEELSTKNEISDYRFTRRTDGKAELTGVGFRGEKVLHRVVTS